MKIHPDAAQSIQNALNACEDEVVLTPGEFEITDNLVQPFKIGGILRGSGIGPSDVHPNHMGTTSALVSMDRRSNPLLKLQGSHFSLRDLTIFGPEVAVGITKLRNGIGSGKHEFANLQIAEANIGFQVAEDPADNNCDVSTFNNIFLTKVGTGFLSLGHQAMSFSVKHLVAQRTNVVADIRAGGCWYFDDVIFTKQRDLSTRPTLLRISQTRFGSRGRAAMGSSNARFEIRNLKTDNQLKSWTIVNMTNESPAVITLIGGRVRHSPNAVIRGNGSLYISDYSYLGPKLIEWHDRKGKRTPSFTLVNSFVSRSVKDPKDLLSPLSSGKCNVRIENNFIYPSGERLADLKEVVNALEV